MFENIKSLEDLSQAYSNLKLLGIPEEKYNEDYVIARKRILSSNTQNFKQLEKIEIVRKNPVYTARSLRYTDKDNEVYLV